MTKWTESARAWGQNLRRLLWPRPAWRAEAEFDYYRVEESALAEQLARQTAWQQQSHFVGLGLVESLGLLDRSRLADLRVLELGAGECMLSQALLRAGAGEVWAADAVPKQIWAAARSTHGAGEPLHCVIADALDLPFAAGSFDLVVANLVLHHIRPLSALFQEVGRVLTPGGQLLALEPAPLVGSLVHDQTSDNEAPLWPGTVTNELSRAGFASAHHQYFWVRLRSAVLGPLSPSYRVSAHKPGLKQPARVALRRPLTATSIPGLSLDTGCPFAPLAKAQLQTLATWAEKHPQRLES
jgi:SAM-dependent methyltransferase